MSQSVACMRAVLAALLTVCLAGPALGFNMNKSITVGDGTQTDGHSTVNGSITIGRSAIVNGNLETVNGSITVQDAATIRDAETVIGSVRLGAGVMAEDVSSVNGTIRLGENVSLDGGISVVNGKIEAGRGSRIARSVENVNGEMQIEGTEIGGDLTTVNGDIWLTEGTLLRGDLVVEKPGGWGWGRDRRKPRIVIGEGVRVLGEIRLEREVELYVSDTATVAGVSGKMSLDDAIRFSGPRP